MEPSRKYRIVDAIIEEESRDSTYIHNLEQLVMEQTIVISELKKDVAQINSSIEEIKKMLGEPKLGNLDRQTYNCFPIANKEDLGKANELVANPDTRANIVRFLFFFSFIKFLISLNYLQVAYIRNLKPPGDTDFNHPFQNIFTDEFLSTYNSNGTFGKGDFTKTEMYKVFQGKVFQFYFKNF